MAASILLPPPGTGTNEVTVVVDHHVITGTYYMYSQASSIYSEAHFRLPIGALPYTRETKIVSGVTYERHTHWGLTYEITEMVFDGFNRHAFDSPNPWNEYLWVAGEGDSTSTTMPDDGGIAENVVLLGNIEKAFNIGPYSYSDIRPESLLDVPSNALNSVVPRSLGDSVIEPGEQNNTDEDPFGEISGDDPIFPYIPDDEWGEEDYGSTPTALPLTGFLSGVFRFKRSMTDWERVQS